MKKVLFGIYALAISASAFGAIMSPGTLDGTNKKVSVALPVKLEANIVDGSKKLFIEGTSGDTFGDVLSLNFGDIAHGQIGKTEGRIRVFRGDTWSTSKFVPTELGGVVTFKMQTDEGTVSNFTPGEPRLVELRNTVVGGAGPTITPNEIKASLEIGPITHEGGEDTKKATEVRARITALTEKVGNDQEEGKYYGSASIIAELDTNAGLP